MKEPTTLQLVEKAYELIGRRVAGGWTRTEIAEAAGLTLKEVRRFENHPHRARFNILSAYAYALGFSVDLTTRTPKSAAPSGHTIEIRLEDDNYICAVTCNEPEGAMCRVTCTHGCEFWNKNHEHPLTPVEPCNVVEWFEATGPRDLHHGTTVLAKDLPIIVEWDNDSYIWRTP